MKNNEVSYDFFDEYSEKMFAAINEPGTLLDTLRLYTKVELNIIRKKLQFSGLCTLNKEELAVALEGNIKKHLSDILKKFTERELLFIKDMLKNNGILHFKEEVIKELHYLRCFGIVGFLKGYNGEKYIYIPSDIILDINNLLVHMDDFISMDEKENEEKLLNGNSLQQILYVEKGQTIHAKIGRNSLCPCGSGKKFKFCCLK